MDFLLHPINRKLKKIKHRRQRQQDREQGLAFDPVANVQETHQGHVRPNSRSTLCLMAHYDADGWIDPYVQYAIKQYAALDAEVVLISTSPRLRSDHIEQVKPHVRQVIRRTNRGIDFGSWRTAMALIPDWQSYERVVITNDSIYGPLFPLSPVFEQMKHHPIWGMTDNWEVAYHVQSFFWVLQQPVLGSQAMADFWNSFCFYDEKFRIIKEYEVGFTQHWIRQDVWPVAYSPYREVRREALKLNPSLSERWRIERNEPLNQTHAFWDVLIANRQFPYLKRDLLQVNLSKRPAIYRWDEVITESGSCYPISLIEKHLQRFSRKQAV